MWCGLDQLRQVVDMFSPVIETVILPSQLDLDTIISEQESFGLFNRGEGVNVFSEDFYRIKIYFSSLQQYLHNTEDNLDVRTNIRRVVETGNKLVKNLEEEERIFRRSRTKQGFAVVSSFQAYLHLVQEFKIGVTSDEDNCDTELDTVIEKLNHLSLWNIAM